MTGGVDGGAAHHRPDQRLAHHADGPRHAVAGTRTSPSEMGIPLSMLPEIRSSLGGVRQRSASAGCCAGVPIAGDPRRPAGGHVRPGVPVGRRGQEHLRHRQLHADQHRHARRCRAKNGLLTTVCYKIGDQPTVYALEGSIAVTGSLVQWIRDNLGHDRLGAGDRGRWPRRSRTTAARYFVPAFSGPVRAVLARRRPRRDRRPDPVRQQGPHRPRGAGGHGLPEPARCSTR